MKGNIILVPSNSLTAKDIKKMEDAGYSVIVTDEPQNIKFLNQEESLLGLTKDALLAELIKVVYTSNANLSASDIREWLMRIIFSKLKANQIS